MELEPATFGATIRVTLPVDSAYLSRKVCVCSDYAGALNPLRTAIYYPISPLLLPRRKRR